MSSHPDTIKYPNGFDKANKRIKCPHCGNDVSFDGIFNWDWLIDPPIFPRGIAPMDFDGVVELNCHYLIFETKDIGVPVPKGQQFTLERIRKMKSVMVIKLWGKDKPDDYEIINTKGCVISGGNGITELRRIISFWKAAAEKDEMSRFAEPNIDRIYN